MPEDNIITAEYLTDRKRKVDFGSAVKKQDLLIRDALSNIARQVWGTDVPIEYKEKEREEWSHEDHRNSEGFEALWYTVNRERSISHQIEEKFTRKTQIISYEVLSVSVLSAIRRPLTLAIGRPKILNSFADQTELFEWEDAFRRFRTGVDSKSLRSLMGQYAAHGPSRVYKTTYSPIERTQTSKSTAQMEI